MDIELALLSRAIQTGGVDRVVAEGVEPKHFNDPLLKAVYSTCQEHFRIWRVAPSLDLVKRYHPEFKPTFETNDLGALISEFRIDCEVKAGIEKWRDIGNMLDKAEEGDREARASVASLFMEHSRELAALIPLPRSSRMSDMVNRVATIKRQQEEGLLPGVRIGIPQLDPWVHVVRPSEFAVHCGYSSRGKTTGLVRSVAQAYSEGENALLLTLEMEADEIWEIFDAHATKLSRQAIRKRELGDDDYGAYEEAAERVRNAKNDIIVIDDTDGSPTIDKLAGLIERHRPDVVAVDYVSLMASHMKSQSDWERVSIISKSLKQLARSSRVKLYAAAQNNRDAADNGPTEDNIAFSNSIFQDCNVMVGYHQDPEMEKIRKVEVRLIKSRGSAKGPTGSSGYGTFYEFWDRDRMIFEDWEPRHEWSVKKDAFT